MFIFLCSCMQMQHFLSCSYFSFMTLNKMWWWCWWWWWYSNKVTASYFHILSNPLLTKYPIMQHYIVWTTGKETMQDFRILSSGMWCHALLYMYTDVPGDPAASVIRPGSLETLVPLYYTIWCHILNIFCHENLIYHATDTSAVRSRNQMLDIPSQELT
jgi:hypothetical protein